MFFKPTVQFNDDFNSGLFGLSHIKTDNDIGAKIERPHALEIIGMIVKNELVIDFIYNKKQFKEKTIENLAKKYIVNLERIVAHCYEKETADSTPSDFTYSKLSIDKLDKLTNILGRKE